MPARRLAIVLLLLSVPARAEDPPLPRPQPLVALCDDHSIVGVSLPPIPGEGGCGVSAPVLVSEAAGVTLDPPATIGCGVARALAAWLAAVKPSFPSALSAVTVVDAYSCRNRNRAAEGRLSQHALGNAIDLAAFRSVDGATITVAAGWSDPVDGALLRRLHAAACGPFCTVLGPKANALHADHLHLDTKVRRSGPYCE